MGTHYITGGWGDSYKNRRGCSSELLKYKNPALWRWLEIISPLRGTNSYINTSPVVFFRLNTLKGTTKARAVDLSRLNTLRADLHDTTLTHATSLRQAYDMTWDHLHGYDIFTYKIKYAKVFTGIYGAKKL